MKILNIKLALLTVCFVVLLPSALSAQELIESWVARYNGSGNSIDIANAIAVDAAGNIYVTGKSSGNETSTDYATIKYDTDGNELWVRRYNGPGNYYDEAYAIAVDEDAEGNVYVYVTGYSYGSGTHYDYATIKYDTDGNELWVKRYNGPANYSDTANAIAVNEDAEGNVYIYVTGKSYVSYPRGYDYATIKYDTDGNELWVRLYNSGSNDLAYAMAVDAAGNVYVTGRSNVTTWTYDYATVKYDAEGNQKWVKLYNGPGNLYDTAFAIAVDAAKNVYVTGGSYGSSTRCDYATIKYDTDGNELWVKRYIAWGTANAIAVDEDAAGNVYVYVTGYSKYSTRDDYATIKYDTDGNTKWVKRYNGPRNSYDRANAIAVDAAGNIYVTGKSYGSGTQYDYATIKYDKNSGNQLWDAQYNGPGNSEDYANAIAVDADGNVYVTGCSTGSGTSDDYATIKYGYGTPDSDWDGIPDSEDNCPYLPNPDQTDNDNDEVGDVCDTCTDTDGDGYGDPGYPANTCALDNCPDDQNPDQGDVDDDSVGDVCDNCPSVANPDQLEDDCNTNRSAAGSIGSEGGTITTPDGSVTINVPPGALDNYTSISITDETGTSFELTTNIGNGTALFGVTIEPEGLTFLSPITIVFSWKDVDDDGTMDGTNIKEDNVLITKDNVAVTDRCKFEPGCDTAANTFTIAVLSLSEFALLVFGPPTVLEITASDIPVEVNTEINVSASFTDPCIIDTHTAEWDWGDGTTDTGTVTETNGSGTVEDSHIYTIPGVYTITLTVADDESGDDLLGTGLYQYVVIYDPEGGFVTGGGWIDSPQGAYTADPTLTGKANFGFVSKYKQGASVPTGQTQFQFKVADLNFHSDNYEWLVIAGARAQYKGIGSINGEGEYKFLLTAIDACINENDSHDIDRFRIKIWTEDEFGIEDVVYDNGLEADDTDDNATTEIGGGSIVIHKK